jgi:signal transduction histidine kinase
MISSLRGRIALGTTVATALVVLTAAVTVWLCSQAIFQRTIDSKLMDRTRSMQQRGVLIRTATWKEPLPAEIPTSNFLLQVLHSDLSELQRSPSMTPSESLVGLLRSPMGQIVDLTMQDGRPVRGVWVQVQTRHFAPQSGASPSSEGDLSQPVLALLVYDMSAIYGELHRLSWLLLATWIGAVILSALVSVWLCRAVLRPVNHLSQTIQDIDPTNLTARIDTDRVPVEMTVVFQRLNDLFDRVQGAINREKATIANIAHELRTPIAGLRTTLEFAMARQGDASARQVHDRCLGMVLQMQAMITNLLTLARLEAGQDAWHPEKVDIVDLLHETWDVMTPQARARKLNVVWSIPEHATLVSSREQLRLVVSNLLDNATSHTPAGGDIEIKACIEGAWMLLLVANATDGSLTDVASVFEPFWRGDKARSGGTHCGLGLALVQRLVRCLHGTIEAAVTTDKRFMIRIQLPLAPPSPSDSTGSQAA